MGLVIILALGLYFLIAIGVVAGAVSYAKQHGKSAKRWGAGAALVMFLIPFWDWLPTVATHKYYCETQAGFWVYKTPEQWKLENPGVIETLVANKGDSLFSAQNDAKNNVHTYHLNKRINWVTKKSGPLLFNLWKWEEVLLDTKTNESLITSVDFSTGNGYIGGEPELKFWLHSDGCVGENAAVNGQVYEFKRQLLGEMK